MEDFLELEPLKWYVCFCNWMCRRKEKNLVTASYHYKVSLSLSLPFITSHYNHNQHLSLALSLTISMFIYINTHTHTGHHRPRWVLCFRTLRFVQTGEGNWKVHPKHSHVGCGSNENLGGEFRNTIAI